MFVQENPFAVEQFHWLLRNSNRTLAVSLLVFIVTALISYTFEEMFSIPQLILSHTGLICSSILVKFSYLVRCIAQHNLHMEVC